MKFNFNITNTMIGNIRKDFFLLPNVQFSFTEIGLFHYYTIHFSVFTWDLAFTLRKKIGQ